MNLVELYLEKRKITFWFIASDDQIEFTFHHAESGWVDSAYPLPIREEFVNQRLWAKSKWKKQLDLRAN